MPEKKASVSFDALMRQLKNGEYAPVYLLMGDEPYYIDKLSNFFQNKILTPEQQAFDLTVVFGADVNAAQIADLAMQYPMTAPRKVIIVKEAQGLKSFDKLEKYVLHPQPKTILVFCYKNGTVNRRLKFAAAVDKVGVIFESKKLKEWQLPKYINDYVSQQKASIDEKSAAMMADHIGADISRLTSELDKLLISLPENDRRITPDIVERNVGVSKDFNAFELRDAIVNKNIYLQPCAVALQLLPESDAGILCSQPQQSICLGGVSGHEKSMGRERLSHRYEKLLGKKDTTDFG